ncbi:hypothetical protein ALP61_06020 [Pseudomonas savastanoi]|nr:hypothetical protein ALP61_06020 [Pseudomonas savastanoi]
MPAPALPRPRAHGPVLPVISLCSVETVGGLSQFLEPGKQAQASLHAFGVDDHDPVMLDCVHVARHRVALEEFDLFQVVVGREAAAIHACNHQNAWIGLGNGLPAHCRPFLVGLDDITHAQAVEHEVRDAFAACHERVAGKVGAGEPEQRRDVIGLVLPDIGDRCAQAGLEVGNQRVAAIPHIENLRQLLDALVDGVDAERLQACAIGTDQIVLAFTVGRQDVSGYLQVMELLAGADHALFADHPLQLHGHQFRSLANHRFETGLVVGQALDLVVLRLEAWQYIVEPQGSADQSVAKAQFVKHFGAGLANGHCLGRRMRERQGRTTVFEGQRILSRRGEGQGGQRQAGGKYGKAGQRHEMRSPLEQVPRRNAHQETHPRQMTGHDGKCCRVRMSFPDTPPVSGLKQVGRSPDWHVIARLRPSRS